MERFVSTVAHAAFATTVVAFMLLVACLAILLTLVCAPPLGRLRNRRFHARLSRIQAPSKRLPRR